MPLGIPHALKSATLVSVRFDVSGNGVGVSVALAVDVGIAVTVTLGVAVLLGVGVLVGAVVTVAVTVGTPVVRVTSSTSGDVLDEVLVRIT